MIILLSADKLHVVASLQRPVHYAEIADNATEGIEDGVEHQRLQRSIGVALRSWHTGHYSLQYLRNPLARLGATGEDILTAAAKQVDNLVGHLFGHGTIEVYLVHHWNDFQVVLKCQIEV